MSIVVGQLKKDAAFKFENGDIIHILESNVEKGWQSAKGKLKYNTIKVDGTIIPSLSSFDTFKPKMVLLTPIPTIELAKRYNELAELNN